MSEEKESESGNWEEQFTRWPKPTQKINTHKIYEALQSRAREQNFLKEQILSQTILDCFFGLKWAAFGEQSSKKKGRKLLFFKLSNSTQSLR